MARSWGGRSIFQSRVPPCVKLSREHSCTAGGSRKQLPLPSFMISGLKSGCAMLYDMIRRGGDENLRAWHPRCISEASANGTKTTKTSKPRHAFEASPIGLVRFRDGVLRFTLPSPPHAGLAPPAFFIARVESPLPPSCPATRPVLLDDAHDDQDEARQPHHVQPC